MAGIRCPIYGCNRGPAFRRGALAQGGMTSRWFVQVNVPKRPPERDSFDGLELAMQADATPCGSNWMRMGWSRLWAYQPEAAPIAQPASTSVC